MFQLSSKIESNQTPYENSNKSNPRRSTLTSSKHRCLPYLFWLIPSKTQKYQYMKKCHYCLPRGCDFMFLKYKPLLPCKLTSNIIYSVSNTNKDPYCERLNLVQCADIAFLLNIAQSWWGLWKYDLTDFFMRLRLQVFVARL